MLTQAAVEIVIWNKDASLSVALYQYDTEKDG